ncbi:MAG: MFS transporter [Planctomycetia bacterium]|nr:MFS transporter [Planctomycetia bacterium]
MPAPAAAPSLSTAGRRIILIVALLGWMASGFHMAITQLIGQAAMIDLLEDCGELDAAQHRAWAKQFGVDRKAQLNLDAATISPERKQFEAGRARVAGWFAWFQASLLFGAATGGLLFGWLGDRYGRARGMTVSILTLSSMAAVAYFARSPEQLCIAWFFSCLGVGGMWPNGVAMISEAWAGGSRSMVSGVMGTSANVGLFLMNTLAAKVAVTSDNWRWTLLVGAASLVLGIFALVFVPESPRWLALHRGGGSSGTAPRPAAMSEVFRGPLLATTLVAIALSTVPTMGGWGSAVWMQPWADEAGAAASPPDPYIKAYVGQARAVTGIVGSLLGGWIAAMVGRKLTFFLTSLACLSAAQFTFWRLVPTDAAFLPLVAVLGFFSGIYFGWLPLCLPEFFPMRNRSTGAGVGFNFGRIITATTLISSDGIIRYFAGDYAHIGRATSMIFAIGMIVIWFAPDTESGRLED